MKYSHVINGVCFTCWGSGTKPKSTLEIQTWLSKARNEYQKRQAAFNLATGKRKAFLKAELALLVRMGKEMAARLVKLQSYKPIKTFQSFSSDTIYEIKQAADGSYYCSCPAWKFQKIQPQKRTCKHLETFRARL